MKYEVVNRDIPFVGRVFRVEVDQVLFEGKDKPARRETIIHPGGTVVVPVKANGKILLIKQFRYAHNEVIIELPAGKLEYGEDPQLCATRELKEETGYSTSNISNLGKIYTTCGFCNEVLHMYVAKDLIEGDHAREDGEEGIELIELSLDEIDEKIISGEIVDAKTICGINLYKPNVERRV